MFLYVEAVPVLLNINGQDTGETINLNNGDVCDLSEARTHLKNQGIISTSIIDKCHIKKVDHVRHAYVKVVRWVNVYEETSFTGSVVSFTVRKEWFYRNLGIQKDDKGKILALKDRKTTLTGIQVWEKLKLKDGDKLYKTNPEAVKNVKELEKFEIKFDTESVMILEEQNALYVTRAKN
ncbi:hypothetical protein Ddc_24504 [Ditylenchus destructor]|nr:hypothetical protein Ddc_24504 [Ditylenchus destructor]